MGQLARSLLSVFRRRETLITDSPTSSTPSSSSPKRKRRSRSSLVTTQNASTNAAGNLHSRRLGAAQEFNIETVTGIPENAVMSEDSAARDLPVFLKWSTITMESSSLNRNSCFAIGCVKALDDFFVDDSCDCATMVETERERVREFSSASIDDMSRILAHKKRRSKPPSVGEEKDRWTRADGASLKKIREGRFGSQAELARFLGIHRSLVSAWERGDDRQGGRPHSRHLLKMAAKSGLYEEEIAWLLQKTQVAPETFQRALEIRLKEEKAAGSAAVESGDAIRVQPMLTFQPPWPMKLSGKLDGCSDSKELVFPREQLANPFSTKYFRVKDDFMRPFFSQGDLLLIDESARDPWQMADHACVAAYRSPEYATQQHWTELKQQFEREHPAEVVEDFKTTMSGPYARLGLLVGWLQKKIREVTTVRATATGEHPGLLTPGQPFLETRTELNLSAPWLPDVGVHLVTRRPDKPDVEVIDVSGLVVLGCVVGWLAGSENGGKGLPRGRHLQSSLKG